MTFIQWLSEQQTNGNYVALKCSNLSGFWKSIGLPIPETGTAPPNNDYHCTLVYSPSTSLNPNIVQHKLESKFDNIDYVISVIGAEVFHSTPKDGERDDDKACIVLKLNKDKLSPIHDFLLELGIVHTYVEYSPHVSLCYNMDKEEAEKYKRWINAKLGSKITVRLSNLYSEKINKDYV